MRMRMVMDYVLRMCYTHARTTVPTMVYTHAQCCVCDVCTQDRRMVAHG